MKRREVLKGLTLVAGSALSTNSALSMIGLNGNDDPAAPLAMPIRGLVSKNGKLLQPIQISLQHAGENVVAITSLNGAVIDKREVSPGTDSFRIFVAPVSTAQDATLTVSVGDSTQSATIKLEPVRKVLVYILPHSHHDLGYTDLQAEIEEKQMRNITRGIELARKTASYPQGARYVWNLEVLWGADQFMRRKSQAEKDELIDAVKKGWVSLNGAYANELTGLCRPEELVQLFRYSAELGHQCGVSVDSVMQSDVPGDTWGMVAAMAQAGLRYFSAAPNFFDRIGTFMVEWQDKPFWWVSPSGKEKVLVWVPWTGYAMSHVMKLTPEWVGKYQDRLDIAKFPYDISHIRWSGHGDNAEPDPEICEFVKSWNQEYEWPKFEISSTSIAFSAFEKKYGNQLPEFKGDLTPYWEDGAGSSALETRMNRNAADRLTQAASLSAMLAPGTYRPKEFNEAWRNVLLYSEHTWGAWCSVSDSENPFTTKQWDVKRAFAVDAERESEELLRAAIRSHATGKDASLVDVHNATSWPRTEVVVISASLSAAGDHVRDDRELPVPSQRLSTGELAFLARDVKPFATARFHLSAEKPHPPVTPVSIKDGILGNGVIRVKVDSKSGNLVEMTLHGIQGNLVDTRNGGGANEYLFLEGKDVSQIQHSGPAKITVEEAGPLVACLRVESAAPGCKSLIRRLRLVAGADWVEISNVVDKKRAPLNPHPGKGGPGDEFAQHEAKESLQFAFPFNVPDGQIHIDIPLGEMRPEIDQLPGSCKNWLSVGRWADVANQHQGVTWVTLDAPLMEIGGVTATMLGSQKDPTVWREHIEPTQKFFSWAINNHWGTNYRAYQEGVIEFRYALRPHRGYDPAAASRLAIGLSQPLIASSARSEAPASSLLQIEPADVLALALKPSDDGDAWVVRLFGASGKERKARLFWSTPTPPRLWLSDVSEKQLKPLDHEVTVAGWDLVTVRAERT